MIDTDKMCQRLKQPCSKRVPLSPNMEEALRLVSGSGTLVSAGGILSRTHFQRWDLDRT